MSRETGFGSGLFAVGFAVVLVASAFAGAAAASHDGNTPTVPTEEALVVDLVADGDAHVTTTITFDLSEPSERDAYERLKGNETKQQRILDRFATRLGSVAANVENQTGREMTVKPTRVTFQTAENGSVGIALVTVTWTNLAAEQNGTLVVREPFSSGFELPNRQFVLHAPEGYGFAELTPKPDSRTPGVAVWAEDTSLDGFRAVASEEAAASAGTTTEGTSTTTPGVGLAAGGLATLLAGLVRMIRRP